jgi:hypothetical protein
MKRADIISAMQTRFQGILTTGGYHSNLGLHVYVGKTSDFDENQVPGLSLIDAENTVDQESLNGSGSFYDQWLGVKIVLAVAGSTSLTLVREMIADVYKAIGVDHTWGGLAHYTNVTKDALAVTQEDRKIAGADIDVMVYYRTTRFEED